MAEIAFLSDDPDNESSCHNDVDNCEEPKVDAVHVPKMAEIEDHINSYEKNLGPGAEVIEICDDTVNPLKKVNAEDFQILKVIGKGGYGTVFLVQKTTESTDKYKFYAMKVLKKARLIRNEKNTVHTVSERNILQILKHPFLVRLHYAFQNRSNLYIVLEYCPGGELFRYLERECFLMEDDACFYISEIALAIGHLHSLGIIYRDLKPENILLDKDGHVKLTDFGLSKEGVRTTNTFCGTIEYMAPEIIRCAGHGTEVDWWSLGTLLFDMLSGGPPFSEEGNKKATAEKVLKSQVRFPPSFSTEAIHLIRGLLKKDPKERLGSEKDVDEIKAHSFFVRRRINWIDVYNRMMVPPYKPVLSSESDVSMFDPSFTGMKPVVSPGNYDEPVPSNLFEGFSFVASSVMEPPRALVPDLSRFRSGQRYLANREPGASPQKGILPSHHVETNVPPSSFACGVNLRDFASPSVIKVGNGVKKYGGLSRVCEGNDEDNIPGAKTIRINGGSKGGNAPLGHTNMSVAVKSTTYLNPSTTATLHSASKNGPRRLADTKPCSYPNLLITRTCDSVTSSGHPSSGDLINANATGVALSPTSASANSVASSASSSNHSKSHHHHHLHRQVASGGGGKDSKCSLM